MRYFKNQESRRSNGKKKTRQGSGKNTKYGKFIKTAASTRHMREDITDEYWKWYFEGT